MKQHRALTFGLVLVMMFAIMPFAFAGDNPFEGRGLGRGHHGGRGGKGFGKMMGLGMLRAANLTDTQKSQVVTIIKSHLDAVKANVEAMESARENMGNAMFSDDATEETVRAAHQAAAAVKEEGAVLRFTIMTEIKAILTEDQITQIKAKRAERIERKKQRSENRWTRFEEWLDQFATQ